MRNYKIEITETLQKQIEVEASSKEEAERIVKERYLNEKIVLSSSDHIETKISAIQQTKKRNYMKR